MKLETNDKSILEIITIDFYTGEGTEDLTISIYNKMCKDSAHINLNYDEVRKLIDELNEWLNE